VIPELRSDHVVRSAEMYPSDILYFGEYPDLGATPLPDRFLRVSILGAMRKLFGSRSSVLEIPEPLWVRFLPKTVLLTLAWRAGSLVRRKRRFVVTFAIENNSLERVLFGNRRIHRSAESAARWGIRSFVKRNVDRIAFGSEGSRRTYGELLGDMAEDSAVFEDLPNAMSDLGAVSERKGHSAVFVGQLERRKGLGVLQAAWPEVEAVDGEARLTIVGDGPLFPELSAWAGERPETRRCVGRLEHSDIGAVLSHNDVLVAPSIPDGRWREQIGAPIREALAHGLTVVTSDETGIAEWLAERGHTVVPVACLGSRLGSAMARALRHPLDRWAVAESLPDVAGRVRADRWLHSVAVGPDEGE
jgi:glycosyltransferase involved in cell wall biosynthesis